MGSDRREVAPIDPGLGWAAHFHDQGVELLAEFGCEQDVFRPERIPGRPPDDLFDALRGPAIHPDHQVHMSRPGLKVRGLMLRIALADQVKKKLGKSERGSVRREGILFSYEGFAKIGFAK
ncbi:MAG: hypothetical protein ACP59X_07260 [Solidesulfovibrio sp. DCME]|uniref:hypothetical protein n=1 Tax=Solidesulfovibrio sp. DCME TaxID=3447380 RepID=UPI003D0DDBE7